MTKKSEIILTAEAELHDNALREWVSKIDVRLKTLNDRTKIHTIRINELEKQVNKKLKELEKLVKEMKK